jgi:hypothetical protein
MPGGNPIFERGVAEQMRLRINMTTHQFISRSAHTTFNITCLHKNKPFFSSLLVEVLMLDKERSGEALNCRAGASAAKYAIGQQNQHRLRPCAIALPVAARPGAHSVGSFTMDRASANLIVGRPAEYQSSPAVLRRFCSRCGTSLTY